MAAFKVEDQRQVLIRLSSHAVPKIIRVSHVTGGEVELFIDKNSLVSRTLVSGQGFITDLRELEAKAAASGEATLEIEFLG